jgi:hypothetical protein
MRPFLPALCMLVAGSACDRGTLGVWSTPGEGRDADVRPERDAPPPDLGPNMVPPVRGTSPPLGGESAPDAADGPDGSSLDLSPDLPGIPPDTAGDLPPDPILSCTVTPSDWIACNGTCGMCADMVAAFDLYFQNHPRCRAATTRCEGATRTCNSDCPRPTISDVSCRASAAGWQGCVISGCAIDPAAVEAYPGYFTAHPFCHPANVTHSGNRVGCSAACPPPTESDRMERHGSTGGWGGCRGYGLWACVELLEGYPRYFKNNPLCVPNGTCAGEYYACNEACPAPGPADR